MIIDSTTISDLSNAEYNRELLLKIRTTFSRAPDIIYKDSNIEIIHKRLGDGGEVIAADYKQQLIRYYMRYGRSAPNMAVQFDVWKDSNYKFSIDVVSYVFFNFLLKNFNFIRTDSNQTTAGKKMWIRLLKQAAPKYNIYLADANPGIEKIEQYNSKEGPIDKWINARENIIWGKDPKHADIHLVIEGRK